MGFTDHVVGALKVTKAIQGGDGRNLVGAGRIELPTSCSQSRRPTAGPRPGKMSKMPVYLALLVPPERVELSSPALEAGTLSTELQGHFTIKNSTLK